MLQCLWPQVCGDGFGPPVGSMQEHRPRAFSNVMYTSFSIPILVMGANSTEGNSLMCLLNVLDEGMVSKMSIVTMIIEYVYPMLICHSFKGMFGFQSFLVVRA